MTGKLVHFELPSKDTARAKAFWSGAFGWDVNTQTVADPLRVLDDADGRGSGGRDL